MSPALTVLKMALPLGAEFPWKVLPVMSPCIHSAHRSALQHVGCMQTPLPGCLTGHPPCLDANKKTSLLMESNRRLHKIADPPSVRKCKMHSFKVLACMLANTSACLYLTCNLLKGEGAALY
jgi:hypothetical protein